MRVSGSMRVCSSIHTFVPQCTHLLTAAASFWLVGLVGGQEASCYRSAESVQKQESYVNFVERHPRDRLAILCRPFSYSHFSILLHRRASYLFAFSYLFACSYFIFTFYVLPVRYSAELQHAPWRPVRVLHTREMTVKIRIKYQCTRWASNDMQKWNTCWSVQVSKWSIQIMLMHRDVLYTWNILATLQFA